MKTEAEQSALIQRVLERTKAADPDGLGSTRAGCRAALMNSGWDVDRAMEMFRMRPWMAVMQPTGEPPTIKQGD